MKRIGIQFGDNDFCNTFKPVMKTFLEAYEYNPEGIEKLTKEQVVYILNELVFGVYMLFQNIFQYGNSEKERLSSKVYLELIEREVLFDEEVDEKLIRTNFDCNHSFYWVDFDCKKSFCC